MNHYKVSQVLVIDTDKFHVVGRPEDAAAVCKMVEGKLAEINKYEPAIEFTVKIFDPVEGRDKEKALKSFKSESYDKSFKDRLTAEIEDIFVDAKVTDIKIELKEF